MRGVVAKLRLISASDHLMKSGSGGMPASILEVEMAIAKGDQASRGVVDTRWESVGSALLGQKSRRPREGLQLGFDFMHGITTRRWS